MTVKTVHAIMKSPVLSCIEKVAIVIIASERTISYNALAKKMNVSRNTAVRAVSELERYGVLTHNVRCDDESGGLMANEYTVLDNDLIWKCKTEQQLIATVDTLKL